MNKIAYLDCSQGISGDMILGAFVDSGLSVRDLKKELSCLEIGRFDLKAQTVKRGHISGTKIDISAKSKIHFSDLKSILKVIDTSGIDSQSKQIARTVFTNLAQAEAKVHKQDINDVHFHQLGQLDTMVDIVGCALALKLLGIEKMYSSAVMLGEGKVKFEGTELPLPAPATLELLKGRKVTINPLITHEIVTPTGAAIITSLSEEKPGPLSMRVLNVGYGAGTYNNEDSGVNLLRLVIAEPIHDYTTDTINVIETNLDDMLALNFELLFERLFAAGALDVYTVPIMMKKSRPGILLSVQAPDDVLDRILSIIFAETTTLGVRINKIFRRKAKRKILNLETDYGIIVRVKIATVAGKVVNVAPEYEDCKKISQKQKLPFKLVYEQIKAQAYRRFI